MISQNNSISIPSWLDELIFHQMKAKYCKSNQDMLVIDWNRDDVLCYLGTYFPRSYTEAYCIFSNYLNKNKSAYSAKQQISIFDFGSGTGGEIIGLITAVKEQLPHIELIKVRAFDGNKHALRMLESIIEKASEELNISVQVRVTPLVIEDFYDMSKLLSLIKEEELDFFITFKAICEFVTKQQFVQHNPYHHIIECFLPKLKTDGIMCIADVTSYNNTSQEWLPHMMDQGICKTSGTVVQQNEGYNEAFYVSHSRKKNDITKIAWRIIKK